jgi:ribosomal protein S18 acetylase RimI-like enzyme
MGANPAITIPTPSARQWPREVSQRRVRELSEEDRAEVLSLLSEDPLRSVLLRGMIEDHGICHPSHRGSFFGYYEDDRLAGVALLGHHILIHAEPEALSYFARAAAASGAKGHLILGPQAQVEEFWAHFSEQGRETKQISQQLWYVCHQPQLALDQMQLRRANLDELDVVAEAQAEMAREASGTDPRLSDPEGFRQRVAERIKQGRTWVKILDGKVVFKAELMRVTPEVVYLEGVWTHPEYRNRGIAQSCLTELVHRLMRQALAVCLLVESEEKAAIRVYEKVGFTYREDYQARFLKPRE